MHTGNTKSQSLNVCYTKQLLSCTNIWWNLFVTFYIIKESITASQSSIMLNLLRKIIESNLIRSACIVLIRIWCTCFRSCWTIPRNACSSQMRRYKQIICWPRRNLCATMYSQWSVHNLKIRHERFLMVLVKYWSRFLIRIKCCNGNIGFWQSFSDYLTTYSSN